MAVSIEAAFVLLDKASAPLKKIEKQAQATDKALRGMGGTGSGGMPGYTRQFTTSSKAIGETSKVTKQLATETEKMTKKVEKSTSFFKRLTTEITNWRKGLSQTNPALTAFATVLGGALGGVKGLATALPLMVSAAIVAAPAIVALTGAVGALGSSLAFAVGGGALLGGGLLASFAVGLGSIALIAKPAITATQNYQKAVKNLNTALASGSPTAIKARQQQLDAIAKANPGVAQLAGNLKKFTGEWKKATAPARASFFKLAADGIQTLRGLLPTLAGEANKNTAALQQSFQKILSPFLDSSTFKGFISGLGGIFRANLPGFMTGIVNIFKGLSSILKVLTPQLDRAGPSFAKFTGHFAKWAASAGGKSTIKEMGKSFTAWLDLVKQIGRIMGQLVGAGAGPGTGEITKWAGKVQGLADTLKKPASKNSMASFFQRSLDDVNKLWPVLKNVASSLKQIYGIFKPLGGATAFLLKNLPPAALTAAFSAYVGIKGAMGAFKGAKSVFGFLSKNDGSSEEKSLWVRLAGLGGGGGGGGGGPFSKLKKKFGKGGKGGELSDATAAEEDVAKVASAGGDVSALSKLGSVAMVGGKIAGAVGVILAIGQAAEAFSTTKGNVGKKAKAAVKAIDPSNVLHVFGLPSISDQVFSKDKPNIVPGLVNKRGRPLMSAAQFAQSSGIGYATAQADISASSKAASRAFSAQSLLDYGKDVDKVKGHLALLTPKQLDALKTRGDQLEKDKNLEKYKGQIEDVRDALNHPTSGLAAAAKKVVPAFDYMKKGAGKNLDTITLMSKFAIDQINNTLPQGSAAATQALAQNFAISADDVRTSMQQHVISTQQGIAAIAALMAKAFQTLGISPGVARSLAKEGWTLPAVQKGLSSGAKSGLTAKGASPMASTTSGSSYQWGGAGVVQVQAGTVLTGNATGGRLPGEPRGDHLPLFGRGGNLLGIADGGELVVNRHTEGRINMMLGGRTTLGREVAGEKTPHAKWATGGRISSNWVPGFQNGGVVGEVNSLASAAGFNKTAIAGLLGNAMQESSLNPNTPGGGLWQQITNFGSGTGGTVAQQWARMLPQIAGIRGAMNRAGSPGAAATIFEQSFEKAGIPALANRIKYANEAFAGQLGAGLTGGAGGGVAIPVLKAPQIGGPPGAWQTLGQGVVNNVTTAANAYLQRVGGSGGGGAVPRGAAGTVMDPSGKLVAGWIEPILGWARQHGWGGSVTSGYRSFADQTRIYNSGVRPAAVPGTSNHEGTVYPRGAVDVSNASQLSSVLSRSPYASTLVWAGSKDPVHFSHPHGGSYALGGRVPWFANGTDFIANRPQVIGVGDRPGGERVTVTPKGQGGVGGRGLHVEIHHIEVNRKGDVQKIVDEELRLLANTIESHL